MKTVEIFDDENSIIVDDDFDVTDFEFFPADKKFTMRSSVKNDCFFNYLTYEYKISTNPIKIYSRLVEKSYEPPPPRQYEVKDGVVLESEMLKDKEGYFLESAKDRILELKKQTEWSEVDILGNYYEINTYILSKHPDIVSKEEYRKFLRQSLEKIKIGVTKVEGAVAEDKHLLEIRLYGENKGIWYSNNESEKEDQDEYHNLPENKRGESVYGKKLEYIRKFEDSLFKKDSPKYVGIPEHEFKRSNELVSYIEKVLDNKHITHINKDKESTSQNSSNRSKWVVVIILSIIALSWGIWTAIGVFIFGSIMINILFKRI